jgi:dephospho-CoA kinase
MIKKTIGITGGIGAGKTFVSSILIKIRIKKQRN